MAAPRHGSLVVIFLTVFIALLGFGMVLPLLSIYAKHFTTDKSGLLIGLLMASFSAMQFLFAPMWGRLSDRIGRRPVLMIGLAGSVFLRAVWFGNDLEESRGLVRGPYRCRYRRRHDSNNPGLLLPTPPRLRTAPKEWHCSARPSALALAADFPDDLKAEASCLRWILRGLSADKAI
jgi:hypothetical protein